MSEWYRHGNAFRCVVNWELQSMSVIMFPAYAVFEDTPAGVREWMSVTSQDYNSPLFCIWSDEELAYFGKQVWRDKVAIVKKINNREELQKVFDELPKGIDHAFINYRRELRFSGYPVRISDLFP